MRPDHGSCLRNTRARLSFPVTTGVKFNYRKQKSDQGLRGNDFLSRAQINKLRVGLVALTVSQKASVTVFSDFREKQIPRQRFLAQ